MVGLSFFKWYRDGWFGYAQGVEAGSDKKDDVFPRAQTGDNGIVQRHLQRRPPPHEIVIPNDEDFSSFGLIFNRREVIGLAVRAGDNQHGGK